MYTRILGCGSYLPEFRLTNELLSTFLDTSDEWIRPRSGIGERRINQELSNTDMALTAAKKAIENTNTQPDELDFIIGCTVSSDYSTPAMASLVGCGLGIENTIAYDISAGCSGFVYALDLADMYIKCGKAKRGLIVCSETLSRIVDYTDRTTCILFGDAAGAVIVGADEQTGILSSQMSGEPLGSDHLAAKKYDNHTIFEDGGFISNHPFSSDPYVYMNGKEVFKFAVRAVPNSLEQTISKSGHIMDEVDHFLLHQANKRIIDAVALKYNIPCEKIPINIEKYGNTSAATIPLLLDEMITNGILKRGDLIAMCGFGAGLTYGSVVARY